MSDINDYLNETYSEHSIVVLDGYDDCICGLTHLRDEYCTPVLIYSVTKILDQLMDDDMTLEDAEDFFDYNLLQPQCENWPMFVWDLQ